MLLAKPIKKAGSQFWDPASLICHPKTTHRACAVFGRIETSDDSSRARTRTERDRSGSKSSGPGEPERHSGPERLRHHSSGRHRSNRHRSSSHRRSSNDGDDGTGHGNDHGSGNHRSNRHHSIRRRSTRRRSSIRDRQRPPSHRPTRRCRQPRGTSRFPGSKYGSSSNPPTIKQVPWRKCRRRSRPRLGRPPSEGAKLQTVLCCFASVGSTFLACPV